MIVTAAAGSATTPATATLLDQIGVRNGETAIHQPFDVVDLGALDVRKAVGVDDKVDSGEVDHGIIGGNFVIEAHSVANVPIFRLDEQTDSDPVGVLLAYHVSKPFDRQICDCDQL